MLKRFFASPWLGAIMCLASVVWEAFWLIGPPFGIVSVEDRDKYLLWGLLAIIICGIQAFGSLLRENKQLKSTLDDKQRIIEARKRIGKLLVELADCEKSAYDGANGAEYNQLYGRIESVKAEVQAIANECLDESFASRFLAVNVYDVQLSEATRMHFLSRAQGSFWTVYQQVNGWRALLEKIMGELNR